LRSLGKGGLEQQVSSLPTGYMFTKGGNVGASSFAANKKAKILPCVISAFGMPMKKKQSMAVCGVEIVCSADNAKRQNGTTSKVLAKTQAIEKSPQIHLLGRALRLYTFALYGSALVLGSVSSDPSSGYR
jgi:hypothetical protein